MYTVKQSAKQMLAYVLWQYNYFQVEQMQYISGSSVFACHSVDNYFNQPRLNNGTSRVRIRSEDGDYIGVASEYCEGNAYHFFVVFWLFSQFMDIANANDWPVRSICVI